MKNAEKIMTVLEKVFSGHKVEISTNYNARIGCVFIDDVYVGAFEDGFLNKDFDDPEIEITIKAPIKDIKDFTNRAVGYEIIRAAVEKGLSKWEKESHPNN